MIRKSLAFIFKNDLEQLLCFVHPQTNWLDVVRGTIEVDETPEQTIKRELFEEAGIKQDELQSVSFIGEMLLMVNGGYDAQGPPEEQTYFGFLVKLKEENRVSWMHTVLSDGIDNGHQYKFEWKEYNGALLAELNPFTKDFLLRYFSPVK